MSKNKFLMTSLAVCIAMTPFIVSAAYNDVTLTTDAVISVGGVSLDVSGSSDVVQSISIGPTSFSVSLPSGSTLTVVSPDRKVLAAVGGNLIAYQCSATQSLLTVGSTADGSGTETVTPGSSTCDTTTTTTTSSGGGNGPVASGGGGGGGPSYIPVVTTNTNTSTTNLQSQIASLLATVNSLRAQLGMASVGTTGVVGSGVFTKNLYVGNRSADVLHLQKILNSDPDTQIVATGAGSPGHETNYFGTATKVAIQKFQVKYGLAGPGVVGYGNFGPKTRAKANEIASLKGL